MNTQRQLSFSSCSVVIPVFNAELSLELLISRLAKVMPEVIPVFEVILVNDGSHDQSWKVICGLSHLYPFVQGINLRRNYGQDNALLCGIRAARCEVIVTMDDDLQHPPEELPKLLCKLDEGFDVVYGSPRKLPHSFWRNLSSRLVKKMLAFVMQIQTVQALSAFRAFRTDLREAFASYQSPAVIIDVLLSWGASRFSSVQVDEIPRELGTSNYNFVKLMRHALLILTGYSTLPLRLASWIGFAMTFLGLGVFIYVITLYFTAGSIPGFPFLVSLISFFSGAQLFATGILGEYLARMFERSMDRPPYVVGERVSFSELTIT